MKTGKDLSLEVIKNLINAEFERFCQENAYDHRMELKTNTDDSISIIYVEDNSEESVNKVYDRICWKYRDHVIGFKPKMYNFYGPNREASFSHWELEFEPGYQEEFYGAIEQYNKEKQEWCDKYGCE